MRGKGFYYRVLGLALVLGGVAMVAHTQRALSKSPVDVKSDTDFDRLDGTGRSGKKVHVVDWEGNLEIHVYPAGSLLGLGLKIDDSKKDKVMVISYRFDTQPKEPLIRRAILTMPMREGFRAYKDPSATEYDKIVVTQNVLAGEMVAYKLEPAPKDLYPEGHPMRAVASTPQRDESRQIPEDGTIQPFFMQSEIRTESQMLRR